MPVQIISRQRHNRIFDLVTAQKSHDLLNIASMRLVLATMCRVFGLKEKYLLGASRGSAHLVDARHVTQYMAHIVWGLSFTCIAHLSCRDRTSVAHACGCVEDKRDDKDFDKALFFLELALMAMAREIRDNSN
ncbi:MAG: helix-turn-helix domain-containing protein [Parvibaculales bacterium]